MLQVRQIISSGAAVGGQIDSIATTPRGECTLGATVAPHLTIDDATTAVKGVERLATASDVEATNSDSISL